MLDQTVDVMYARARDRAQWGALWSVLTGRSSHLLALDEVNAACTVHAHHDVGMHTVPISQIRGSESRCTDFDRDFNPLQEHSRGRWLHIARARKRGKALPPVELVQIDEIYFVRDGHHRISVARALGQRAIEAQVVVWQVSGPLPWKAERRTIAQRLVGRSSLRSLWMAIKMRLGASQP
jgi:hypothetical protein